VPLPRFSLLASRFSLLVALASCSPKAHGSRLTAAAIDTLPGGIVRTMSSAPADSGQWHLALERTVQPAEGAPGELVSPDDVALMDDGTLLVADEKPTSVKVYGADGQYLRTIGREGAGPGELRAAFLALNGDTLLVQDPSQSRVTAYRVSDGTVLGSAVSACCVFGGVGRDREGRLVVSGIFDGKIGTETVPYVRVGFGSARNDTVRVPQHQEMDQKSMWMVPTPDGKGFMFARTIPLHPRDIVAVDPTGEFLIGWSGEYRLRRSATGGDTVAIFGRTSTPEPVSGVEKAALAEKAVKASHQEGVPDEVLRKAFDPTLIPDQRPAFDGIEIDGAGRTWVRLSGADTSQVRFDLFDASGHWLDEVVVPAAAWPANAYGPIAWSRDHVAVVLEDDVGRPMVKIYRIVHQR
jgi:hypothetical protein